MLHPVSSSSPQGRPLRRILPLLVGAGLALGATACVPDAAVEEQDDPVQQARDGPSDAQQAAAPYIGLPEDEALRRAGQAGTRARVGTAADVGQPGQTDDYEVGRLTFVVVDGVVAEVVVETEAGPVTVAAG